MLRICAITLALALLLSTQSISFATKNSPSSKMAMPQNVVAQPSMYSLALRATSAQALTIADEDLLEFDLQSLLSFSQYPSPHFLGRLYSFLQSQEHVAESDLIALAKTASTPLTILNELAKHRSQAVRAALASNPSINKHIVHTLLTEETREIRFSLALNVNFARISPALAADFIREIALSEHSLASTLSKDEINTLLDRRDYYGYAVSTLTPRSSKTEAENLAQRFVCQLTLLG